MARIIELEEMVNMKPAQVAEVFRNGYPIKTEDLPNTQYLGIDLTGPGWFHKFFWKTFRKTFYKDPETGVLRGWNVKLEQTGWQNRTIAKKDSKGNELAFGHYHVCSAKGKKFPHGWQGADYLDYGIAGNAFFDVAQLGYCPIVAVNEGSTELLLGWEVFKIGGLFIPLSDYWLLKRDGALQVVQQPANAGSR